MPFPPWMEAVLGVYKALIEGAGAVAAYQSAVATGKLDEDTPSAFKMKGNAMDAYVRLYYIAAPMVEQAAKYKAGCLEGLPDPSEEMPELEQIPALYRRLSTIIYKNKVISVKFLSRIADEASELEEEED